MAEIPLNTIVESLYEVLDEECPGAEFAIELAIATDCMWSCELRITPEPNTPGPDRSFVSWSVAGASAEEAADRAMNDALDWITERK